MNNTHYALINEDRDIVAVLKKENFQDRLTQAIEDETGDSVLRIDVEETDYNNYKVHAKLSADGFKYTATLRPTWEY